MPNIHLLSIWHISACPTLPFSERQSIRAAIATSYDCRCTLSGGVCTRCRNLCTHPKPLRSVWHTLTARKRATLMFTCSAVAHPFPPAAAPLRPPPHSLPLQGQAQRSGPSPSMVQCSLCKHSCVTVPPAAAPCTCCHLPPPPSPRGKLNALLPEPGFGPQLNFIGLKTQDWVWGEASNLGWILEKPPTAVSPRDLYTAQKLTRARRLVQPPAVVRPMGMCAPPSTAANSSSPRPATGRRSYAL